MKYDFGKIPRDVFEEFFQIAANGTLAEEMTRRARIIEMARTRTRREIDADIVGIVRKCMTPSPGDWNGLVIHPDVAARLQKLLDEKADDSEISVQTPSLPSP